MRWGLVTMMATSCVTGCVGLATMKMSGHLEFEDAEFDVVFDERFNSCLLLGVILLGFTVFLGFFYWKTKYNAAERDVNYWNVAVNASGMMCIVGAGLLHGYLTTQLEISDVETFKLNHLGSSFGFLCCAALGIVYILYKCSSHWKMNHGKPGTRALYFLSISGLALGSSGCFMGAFFKQDDAGTVGILLTIGFLIVLVPLIMKMRDACMGGVVKGAVEEKAAPFQQI